MGLLIPIPRSNLTALENKLHRVAPFDWPVRGAIHVFPLDDGVPGSISDAICEYSENHNIQYILVPRRVHCGEKAIAKAGYTVMTGPAIGKLVHGDGLRRCLRDLRLDWRSEVTSRLSHYALGAVSETAVDGWLRQFERLGNHRAVGEHLLQLLDVLPLAELGEALSTDAAFFGADLVVGFNNDRWGKSWGTVSNLIRKKCPSASLYPITEAIEKGGHPNVLRLVEDGLFSGTEMRGIFDSLRGTRLPGHTQKVPSLADPNILSRVSLQIHCGVVCDFGEAMLRQYLVSNALPNIQISVNPAARKVRVLFAPPVVPSALAGAPSAGGGPSSFQDLLRSRVVPFAFQEDKGWKDAASLLAAKVFCERVGEQLWRNYIAKKNFENFDPRRWPDDRMRLCSLGMEGLGLTLAFPHSVPKASLPLFWAKGPVMIDGTSLDWVPLFPEADS